ncbi:CAP domain-containing protein [Candidatus Chlorohelix sp.]|uniref:CAP domain-containing protein n=1 Tax=Candidatus Chlorohelix sp. TaxID=3139201 RepID=UPI00306F40C6
MSADTRNAPDKVPPSITTADTPNTFQPDEESTPMPLTSAVVEAAGSNTGSMQTFGLDKSQFALDRINYYRSQVGVAAATMNQPLQQAATSHVNYYNLNGSGNYSIHEEIATNQGFSGKDFFARAAKFSYVNPDCTNENIDTIADPLQAIERLMNTLNHRIPLLDPAYPDVGIAYGAKPDGTNPISVIDFGMPVWKTSFQPQFIIWPPNGSSGFYRSYRGESPDMFKRAGLNPAYPIGNPITVTYRGSEKIVYDPNGMSLKDSSGKEVPSYKLADLNSFWTARNSAAISSIQPLAPDTTLTVSFTFSINGGAPQMLSWSFSTSALNIIQPKAGLSNADISVRNLWQNTDAPVATGKVKRSWLYGPEIFDARYEPYKEAPGGNRLVYYLDKARLEINNPAGDRNSKWFVTSGLLTRELVGGFVQVGDSSYEQRSSAQIPVAGDPAASNPNAPTYASFAMITSLNNDKRISDRTGQAVLEIIAKDGSVQKLANAPAPVICKQYDKTLGHNIADVLLTYMNSITGGWVFVLGYPITDPYWTVTKLAGTNAYVLVQLFERRALTYTPSNPMDWRVEMGNIGRHYFSWRYNQ